MVQILIVDDDPICRAIAMETLGAAGHACEEAEDGEAGMARLRLGPVDLVITDLIMPNKEGIETMLEIRKAWPAVKIIAISSMSGGEGSLDLLGMAARLGADATIKKPLRAAQLLEVVDQVLGAKT